MERYCSECGHELSVLKGWEWYYCTNPDCSLFEPRSKEAEQVDKVIEEGHRMAEAVSYQQFMILTFALGIGKLEKLRYSIQRRGERIEYDCSRVD